MAERGQVRDNDGGGIINAIREAVFESKVGKAMGKLLADGTIEAAWRQGATEFFQALKPFPESIQVNEKGTILNPTQGEIADARDNDTGRAPWPSEIAERNRNQPVRDQNQGQDHSQDAGHSM